MKTKSNLNRARSDISKTGIRKFAEKTFKTHVITFNIIIVIRFKLFCDHQSLTCTKSVLIQWLKWKNYKLEKVFKRKVQFYWNTIFFLTEQLCHGLAVSWPGFTLHPARWSEDSSTNLDAALVSYITTFSGNFSSFSKRNIVLYTFKGLKCCYNGVGVI